MISRTNQELFKRKFLMVSYYVKTGWEARGSAWNNIPTVQGEVFVHMSHIQYRLC